MSMGFFLVSLISVAAAHHHRPPLVKWMRERRERLVWQTDSSELERQRTINWDHQRKKEKVLISPCPCVLRGVTGAPGFCGQRRSHRSSLQSPFSLRVNFILSRAIAVHHTRWRLDFFSFVFIWKCQLCLQVQNNKQIPEIWSENKKKPFLVIIRV
jgi:hypothetical protein